MGGDAEPRNDVGEVRSTEDAPCGIVVVASGEIVNLGCASGGQLKAVVGDVIGVTEMSYVGSGGNGECACKGVE